MRSVGDLLVASVHNTYSVDVDHAARQVGEQLGRIEPAEGFLCDQQRLPDHGRRVLHLLEPLGRGRPEPHRGERRLDWVRRPQVFPVLARERVERHHALPVPIERTPDLRVAALRTPHLERLLLPLRLLPRLGVRDLREQAPGLGLALERQLVEDVEDAMVPAPLLLRLRKHRAQRTFANVCRIVESGNRIVESGVYARWSCRSDSFHVAITALYASVRAIKSLNAVGICLPRISWELLMILVSDPMRPPTIEEVTALAYGPGGTHKLLPRDIVRLGRK